MTKTIEKEEYPRKNHRLYEIDHSFLGHAKHPRKTEQNNFTTLSS